MNVEIRTAIKPIDIFGAMEPETFSDKEEREVFLDGKRMSPALERIFLMGMDVATEQYLRIIEKLRKEDEQST